MFYFEEINVFQVPFTIGIKTPVPCKSMLSYGHNGFLSINATFDTNDMKFQLFILMGFDGAPNGNSFSMDHYKLTSQFSQVAQSSKCEGVKNHVKLKTMLFHCR
jgi:hypothetical protein